ncbi:potassium channel family protein [Corynebacterium heidelbergense]|uniref:Potassium transporter n=1 Tax=Corynebacterium heidelbergense TaxID=2055947 RepID=A0A364V8M3_9CORY|nr:TrkA family potassium uptake protein [Corynebacterium heidelbergense]RAV32981.1 potassium transporter [Corynebacterium heidelbergense]
MGNFLGNALRGKRQIDIPPVAVLGLGRFGASLAAELAEHGVEVLGVDSSDRLVQVCSQELTQTAKADTTDIEALRQLGVDQVERVVLAIGSKLEASILTASNLVELGIPHIWAKADSKAHARILTQVGVHHVVRPERDTGRRVAHLLGGRFQDFAEFDENHGMIKMAPPTYFTRARFDPDRLMREHGVFVVSARHPDGSWEPYTRELNLDDVDEIILAGAPQDLESFAQS